MKELDRRYIYLLVFVVLAIPLLLKLSLTPARLKASTQAYNLIENIQFSPGEIAFIALDFGPSTKAENEAQAMVLMEHLFRKRVPVVLFSMIPFAEAFLKLTPEKVAEKLQKENPEETWVYGKDWINLGFRQGATILLQQITKSDDLKELFKADVNGTALNNFAFLKDFKDFNQIKLLGHFTGLVGVFDRYLGFFSSKTHRPLFIHGCTSITIPEAYIYLDSKQLDGLFEGIAGAAWYSHLLNQNFPNREPDTALLVNTGLGVAQLLIIVLIIIGNIVYFVKRKRNV